MLPDKSVYHVMFDVLFDTRIAVAEMLDPEKAQAIVDSGYGDRTDDTALEAIEGYTEHYAARDSSVLNYAVMTKFIAAFNQISMDDKQDRDVAMPTRELILQVNTWPYHVTQEDKNELEAILMMLLPAFDRIDFMHLSLAQLSPSTIQGNNLTLLALYDFREWIKIHEQNFQKERITEVVVLAPEITERAFDLEATNDAEKFIIEQGPFRCMEYYLMEVMALKMWPAKFFSHQLLPD